MVIFAWYLYFVLGRLLCAALELKMTVRYGPEMCESLQKRGCNVTFHRENLTCVLHSGEASSGQQTGEDDDPPPNDQTPVNTSGFRNAKEETVSSHHQSQGLLVAVLKNTLTRLIWKLNLSSRLVEHCALKHQFDKPKYMTCSTVERKIYIVHKYSQLSTWMLGQKIAYPFIGRTPFSIFGVSSDGKRNLLFLITAKGIYALNETDKPPIFKLITIMKSWYNELAVDTEHQLIFASHASNILAVRYSGKDKKTLHTGTNMKGIAYGSKTGSIYFGERNALMKMSVSGEDETLVKQMNNDVRMIQVYHDIVYVSTKLQGGISALEPVSGNILWSQSFFSAKINIFFCFMDLPVA